MRIAPYGLGAQLPKCEVRDVLLCNRMQGLLILWVGDACFHFQFIISLGRRRSRETKFDYRKDVVLFSFRQAVLSSDSPRKGTAKTSSSCTSVIYEGLIYEVQSLILEDDVQAFQSAATTIGYY